MSSVGAGGIGNLNVIQTGAFHGYQVIFSPYTPTKLAFAGANNYGLAGKGALVIYQEQATGAGDAREFREACHWLWKDSLFDVTWSEVNEAVLVAGSGDGSLLIVDQSRPGGIGGQLEPAGVLVGHTAEVSSVQWSMTRQEQVVLSSSWDETIRLWDPQAMACLNVFNSQRGNIYAASWSPQRPHTFASVASDESLCVWDSTQPPASSCTSRVHAHAGEVLTCDWSKYDPNILFTGGVDRTLRSWDLRRLSLPLATLEGHTQAVRRVRCDPFAGDRVASCSYDFSVRWWDISRPAGQQLTQTLTHHSEFTFGLDLCSLEAGKVADCSWDRTIKVYSLLQPAR